MALREDVTVIARRVPARKPRRAEEVVTALGVVSPPAIEIACPRFTGSLATLFACVRERKIDVLEVPLLPVCEAYFIYLLQVSLKDLDQAAAALVALSYLLERKAWALLPVAEPEPEADEPLELIAPSAHDYEQAIFAFRLWEEDRERMFFRPPDAGQSTYEIPFDIGDVTIMDLARAFERLLAKATPPEIAPLNKPRRSIAEQMKIVLKAVSKEWKTLENLIEAPFTREDAVYWFLALLELVRLGQVGVRRNEEVVEFGLRA
jgi:chromatin segregation and condensation protein Rec8/ScpA/Scc1 (kleisin family)